MPSNTNWDGSPAPGPTWGEQAYALGHLGRRLDAPRSDEHEEPEDETGDTEFEFAWVMLLLIAVLVVAIAS